MPAERPEERVPAAAVSEPARRAAVAATGARDVRVPGIDSEGRSLAIPRGIAFSGRIGACETLLVEGVVETDLGGCRALAVAPGGVFRGDADVETAEIAGTVEGNLTVRGMLRLRASGRVLCETIAYGELVIERGGIVIGTVRPLRGEAE